MQAHEITELKATALKVREHIIKLATDGGCFLGASLSCADLILYLYRKFLRLPSFEDPARDYLFLSKGHDVPALYATFVELGYLSKERLENHLKTNDSIYWHPNRDIEGVEYYSGSLGHLPSVALGVALDCKMKNATNRIVVIVGDGELNEGSVWETVLVANAYKLSNLVMVIDRNHFQANMPTEELIPLEPLVPKFEAFGWYAQRVNGHDFAAMDACFSQLSATQPNVIIADTVRGKGLPSIEARADRWFCNFTANEIEQLLQELQGVHAAELTSETLTVR